MGTKVAKLIYRQAISRDFHILRMVQPLTIFHLLGGFLGSLVQLDNQHTVLALLAVDGHSR